VFDMNKRNILITGPPGIGKTTLIKKIAERLREYRPSGFYTEEVRDERGQRIGFDIININNEQRGVLARVSSGRSTYRVGKYSVYLREFEEFIKGMDIDSSSIVIIDEIGKMECFSDFFKDMIKGLIESQRILIATVALKGGGLIQGIKKRKDVDIYHVTLKNRNSLMDEIMRKIYQMMK